MKKTRKIWEKSKKLEKIEKVGKNRKSWNKSKKLEKIEKVGTNRKSLKKSSNLFWIQLQNFHRIYMLFANPTAQAPSRRELVFFLSGFFVRDFLCDVMR